MDLEWLTVEVLGDGSDASAWMRSWRDAVMGAALREAAVEWSWHEHSFGVVFEVAFPDRARLERFRGLPQVRAALDAVPDPLNGLLVYRGRGGGAGSPVPRRPRPLAGAGAAECPPPDDDGPGGVTVLPGARLTVGV